MDTSSLLADGGQLLTLDRERVVYFDMIATAELIKLYGMQFVLQLFRVPADAKSPMDLELVDAAALGEFLRIGLRRDAELRNELVPDVTSWLRPRLVPRIFEAVVLAVTFDPTYTLPGKATAEAAGPAAPAKTTRPALKSQRPTPQRSASSAGRRRSSGVRPQAS